MAAQRAARATDRDHCRTLRGPPALESEGRASDHGLANPGRMGFVERLQMIAATYPSTDSATINYKGSDYSMQIAVSASGARYVGGGFEWWTKGSGAGSEAILFHHMADDTSGSIVELCSES